MQRMLVFGMWKENQKESDFDEKARTIGIWPPSGRIVLPESDSLDWD